jgi:hypothetical protein
MGLYSDLLPNVVAQIGASRQATIVVATIKSANDHLLSRGQHRITSSMDSVNHNDKNELRTVLQHTGRVMMIAKLSPDIEAKDCCIADLRSSQTPFCLPAQAESSDRKANLKFCMFG